MEALAPGRPSPWLDVAVIVVLAAVARAVVVLWAGNAFPPTADGHYYHLLAVRLAEGQGYTWQWPDGSVDYAAHYPVGFSALLALAYTLAGSTAPVVGATLQAVIGVLGAGAATIVGWSLGADHGRLVGRVAGALVALHPGLLLYTPALMTEGLIASLLLVVVALAMEGRRRESYVMRTLSVVALGVAVLVRPQCLVLAPALGWLFWHPSAARGRRATGAVLAVVGTLAVCAPWTVRNCHRMNRCALVSMNGGWNLLIGTDPSPDGGWSELKVPKGCEQVYSEAEKDRCFQRAAMATIAAAPRRWLALVPAKWAGTFRAVNAGPWYLEAANAERFPAGLRRATSAVEVIFERILLALALVAAFGHWWRRSGGRYRSVARWLLAGGLLFCVLPPATPAFLLFAAVASGASTPAIALAGWHVASTAAIHAVFFGGGRYQLVLWGLLSVVAARGAVEVWTRAKTAFRRRRTSGPPDRA
ncbi:MAG: hypothetical protein AAGA56_20335 [Myxococcota bacterium]